MRNSSCEASAIRGWRAHATSALPAWLWSIDGTRILWANPVGAKAVRRGQRARRSARKTSVRPTRTAARSRSSRDRLPANGAIRLERLRGFGAPLGTLVTCACARLDFADGSRGILDRRAEAVGRHACRWSSGCNRLVDGIDTPIAAFARDGLFVGASDAARSLLGFRDLAEAGLDARRNDALTRGRAETPIGIGHMVLQRVGSGADVGLVALMRPGECRALQHRAPRYRRKHSFLIRAHCSAG